MEFHAAAPSASQSRRNMATGEDAKGGKLLQILKDLCTANGFDLEVIKSEGRTIHELESYFYGVPQLVGLKYFPALSTLRLISQELKSLRGLRDAPNLEELWICETPLQSLNGIGSCLQLRKVYLYDNNIIDLSPLCPLSQLQTLWLNNNQITEIWPLEGLQQLRELNLAMNSITRLGKSWPPKLIDLNLSGNPIQEFQDLVPLASLGNLESFAIRDIQYGICKISETKMCNAWLTCHLTNLHLLNGYFVTIVQAGQAVLNEWLVAAKCEDQAIQRDYLAYCRTLYLRLGVLYNYAVVELRNMHKHMQEKTPSVKQRVDYWSAVIDAILASYHECLRAAACIEKLRRLGSQLRLESCQNLTVSWFKVTDSEPFMVGLVALIDQHVCIDILGTMGISSISTVCAFRLHKTPGNSDEIFENCFFLMKTTHWDMPLLVQCLQHARPSECVDVTNSLLQAEACWLRNDRPFQYKYSFLVLVRTLDDVPMTCSEFPNAVSKITCQSDRHESLHCSPQTGKTKPDNLNLEAIVCVKYRWSNSSTPSELFALSMQQQEYPSANDLWSHDIELDTAILASASKRDSKPQLVENFAVNVTVVNLSKQGLLSLTKLSSLKQLKKLDVSHNLLRSLNELSNFIKLETLHVGFNDIRSLDDLPMLKMLSVLGLEGNSLSSVAKTVNCLIQQTPVLKELDLRWNLFEELQNVDNSSLHSYITDTLIRLTVLNGALIVREDQNVSANQTVIQAWTDHTVPRILSTKTSLEYLQEYSSRTMQQFSDETSVLITGFNFSNRHAICLLDRRLRFEQIKWLDISANAISTLEPAIAWSTCLEELHARQNCLRSLPNAESFCGLSVLNIDNNFFAGDFSFCISLPCLHSLSASGNSFTSLQGLNACTALHECYLADNQLDNLQELKLLKDLRNLEFASFSGNPLAQQEKYTYFALYCMKRLKGLDSNVVGTDALKRADELFAYILSLEFLTNRLGDSYEFQTLTSLELPSLGLHTVELDASHTLRSLKKVNLSYNRLKHFGGLIYIKTLENLDLGHNAIRSVLSENTILAPETTVLPNLKQLWLNGNSFRQLKGLQLERVPSIVELYLNDNRISRIEGLAALTLLERLDLSQNRIRAVHHGDLKPQCHCLKHLNLAQNKLSDLHNLECLLQLKTLNVSGNCIQSCAGLKELALLTHLEEFVGSSNSVSQKNLYRSFVLSQTPKLILFDGRTVSADDRANANYAMQPRTTSAVPSVVQAPASVTVDQQHDSGYDEESPTIISRHSIPKHAPVRMRLLGLPAHTLAAAPYEQVTTGKPRLFPPIIGRTTSDGYLLRLVGNKPPELRKKDRLQKYDSVPGGLAKDSLPVLTLVGGPAVFHPLRKQK